ncbi:OmpA family protein, partial [Desulfococcaceae bacterium HSG8]|nr:OmpA family protein [Desulfococcaceae bacterium HSG8]
SEMVDNVEILAIKNMQVQSNILKLVTKIKNSNNIRIKMSEGKFTFYLRIDKDKSEPLSKDELLGTDARPREIILEASEDLMKESGRELQEVEFRIDMGKEPEKLRSLERIVNAVGHPVGSNPIFYIDGRFYLGVESDKGWSSARSRINWVFRPALQRNVLLEASLDLPFPSEFKRDIPEKGEAWDDLKFGLGKYDLKKDAKKKLREYAEILKTDFPDATITIAGYTCELGTEKYNMKLSENRAKAVKNFWVNECGISESLVNVKWYGESKFNAQKGREWNRRVEFICQECRR